MSTAEHWRTDFLRRPVFAKVRPRGALAVGAAADVVRAVGSDGHPPRLTTLSRGHGSGGKEGYAVHATAQMS